MIKGTIQITNNITPKINAMQRKLNTLPDEAYKVWLNETPIRSGNARNNTKLDKNNKKINANYPYAQRLNEGYSKQNTKGMLEPTLDFIREKFRKIISGK